ncbi:hypothetical protein PVAP13_3NG058490 [Panicum virgatum]|uniref:Uncharacterized protein n=1 Tax=Panicum virgatum TaxID=38727 RepID=A0A8T0U3P1_PANVG|nr:hypothetical protein PVAP13_3NG058490 [Panicum virgatum]
MGSATHKSLMGYILISDHRASESTHTVRPRDTQELRTSILVKESRQQLHDQKPSCWRPYHQHNTIYFLGA